MTLSNLSSPHSPGLSARLPSPPAPGHPCRAPAGALQTPEGLPAPWHAARPGPSAPPWRTALPHATPHEIRIPANPPGATAGTGQLAKLPHGFGKPLALAADNYAALSRTIVRLGHDAATARDRWVEHGDRKDLAAAQTLGIQGAVLNGLYSFRLHHKDWLSQTPMVSPATLADLLPLFRHALALCERESDAVRFPIDDSPHPELAHLQARVRESLQSLGNGQWQATAEGACYAERHGATGQQPPGTGPHVFAGLQVACQDLEQVLAQLQSTLNRGAAPRQPAPPAASVAAPPPVEPDAAAAAPLRQAQLAALKAALAPLQAEAGGLIRAAEAVATRSAAGNRPWDLHALEFKAWEAVVMAWDACSGMLKTKLDTLKAEAGASPILDRMDPAVRSLQGAIDKASGRALARAARAADDTLTTFAKTCHAALVEKDLESAQVNSYKELGEHCRELHKAWERTGLRPRLQALEGRMKQYQVYDLVCGVKEDASASDSHARILFKAEQLYEAATLSRRAFEGAPPALDSRLRAFHKACSSERSGLLEAAVYREIEAVYATYGEQGVRLQAALRRRAEIATACDTLLSGNPLPQMQAREPGAPATPAPLQWPGLPDDDRPLIDGTFQVEASARRQREQAIELPAHDVPQRALHEQQAGLAVLHQVELSAQTTGIVLARFHLLARTLGTTPPEAQPALVREHADAMGRRAGDLLKALGAHCATSDAVRDPWLCDQMERSQALLRADLRLVRRMHASLRALEQLLDKRVSARQLRSELEHDRRPDLAGHPAFTGQAHAAIADMLKADMKSVEQDLLKEKPKIKAEAWKAEKDQHDLAASALQRKIEVEKTLIQGRLLLALAGRPDRLVGHRAKLAELFDSLTKINKTLKELAASSMHRERYQEQYGINEEVRRALLVRNLELNSLDCQPTGAAPPSAGSAPAAAEERQATQKDRSSRHARSARRR